VSSIGIVGPGRAGVALGLALSRAGHRVQLHGRHSREVPPPLALTVGEAPPWLDEVEVVLLAVPDDAVAEVAASLAATGAVTGGHTVLHLSGALGIDALAPLGPHAAALGSLHPYQTLHPSPEGAAGLEGAVAGVGGTPEAVAVASALARSVGLVPVEVPEERRALYHAAAVFASNYLVTLAGVAEGLLADVGFSPEQARAALGPLMSAALDNALAGGPDAALTGPVARGDAETVRRHLAALPDDVRDLYRELARAALRLADLPPERRAAVEQMLEP
jgi:predicted short-subunit dehydrogenase-like oxidoreductase (DUF2520 family)